MSTQQLAPWEPRVVTEADIRGTERRWRRGMVPVAAGDSMKEDGSPDYGLFGPGSMVWEVLLHPATVAFHHVGQQLAQDTYLPIVAGIRDHEPIVRQAREGIFSAFDGFERSSRGAGIHGIMWLSDTTTAVSMASFLNKVHQKVAGSVIDSGRPELGGYAAAGPRESMWAALTEMHPMLRMYEAFAFRDGKSPHRLTDEQRDRFIRECAPYLRAHGTPEDKIPQSMADLKALYAEYDHLFGPSSTINVSPEHGYNWLKLLEESATKTYHPSQDPAARLQSLLYLEPHTAAVGALPHRARRALGLTPEQEEEAVAATAAFQERAWEFQQPEMEREILELQWGPDCVRLFESARALHRKALEDRAA